MNKGTVAMIVGMIIVLALASVFVLVSIKPGKVVNVNTGMGYDRIQEAIDANETQDGHTLIISPGVYHESIELTKSLTIKGQDRDSVILERGNISVLIVIVRDTYDVTVANVTLRNSTDRPAYFGIRFINVTGGRILNTRAINLVTGLQLDFSSNCTVQGNEIIDGDLKGIWLFESNNNTITRNRLLNASQTPSIGYGAFTIEKSHNNTIASNDVVNNTWGIWLEQSKQNRIYHNNFSRNTDQAHSGTGWANTWDNGYPSGGNYWSDYTGTDADGNGIGDTPYTIDPSNQDRYPLMTPPTLNVATGATD